MSDATDAAGTAGESSTTGARAASDARAPGAVARLDATGLPLLAARAVLGVTFVVLGARKIGDPVQFLKLIREYALVPDDLPWLLNGMAVALPWLEVWAGALLLLGVFVRGAGATMLLLLGVFTTAILLRALDIHAAGGQAFCDIAFDCGCGSGVEEVCGKLRENAGLLLLTAVPLLSRSRRFCLARR